MRLLSVIGCVTSLLVVASCSSGRSATAVRTGHSPPAPLTSPSLSMQDASHGRAILPSGTSWLQVQTVDGWRHLSNITPAAVPTGGGLSASFAGSLVGVAIGPYDRLLTSAVLTTRDAPHDWTPTQLPGGLEASRHAFALDGSARGAAGAAVTAVLSTDGGSLLRAEAAGWMTLTTATSLVRTGTLTLDSIAWGGSGLGWLTGHGPAGTPVAFISTDDGATWSAITGLDSLAVAALTPCGAGSGWQLPTVRADGTVVIASTSDRGRTWHAGQPETTGSTTPTWGCRARETWLVREVGRTPTLARSTDAGGHWQDTGAAPSGVTDLAITLSGKGFAVGRVHGQARLWSVSITSGADFRTVALPSWVATIGAGQRSN